MKMKTWMVLILVIMACAGVIWAANAEGYPVNPPKSVTIEIPAGLIIPSKAECEAYRGWDSVLNDEYASVFYLDPRKNMPYRLSVQHIQNQSPGVGLEIDVTGTEADPRADKDNPITYNRLQLFYFEGGGYPSTIWITTSYKSVAGLFDDVYLSMFYDGSGQYIRNGIANVGINSEYVVLNYRYGQWMIPDEAKALLNTDGLMEQRLAWIYAYQPKPLSLQTTGLLSIYDLMDKVLRLPNNLEEIESLAFVGVDVDRIIVSANVKSIANDAIDEDILLVLPDNRLEEWAKENHPNYWIAK